jgi:hypothetical protein
MSFGRNKGTLHDPITLSQFGGDDNCAPLTDTRGFHLSTSEYLNIGHERERSSVKASRT